jgi:hypothetical protein
MTSMRARIRGLRVLGVDATVKLATGVPDLT